MGACSWCLDVERPATTVDLILAAFNLVKDLNHGMDFVPRVASWLVLFAALNACFPCLVVRVTRWVWLKYYISAMLMIISPFVVHILIWRPYILFLNYLLKNCLELENCYVNQWTSLIAGISSLATCYFSICCRKYIKKFLMCLPFMPMHLPCAFKLIPRCNNSIISCSADSCNSDDCKRPKTCQAKNYCSIKNNSSPSCSGNDCENGTSSSDSSDSINCDDVCCKTRCGTKAETVRTYLQCAPHWQSGCSPTMVRGILGCGLPILPDNYPVDVDCDLPPDCCSPVNCLDSDDDDCCDETCSASKSCNCNN